MKTDEELHHLSRPGELRALTDDELERYLEITSHSFGAGDILDELRRREAARSERMIRRLTWVIAVMTAAVLAATVLNLLVFMADKAVFITF